jgi:hypothetical protein
MKKSLFVFTVLVGFTLSARAALQWDSLVADLHPKLSDKTAVAHFKYKNTGDKPVKILAVKPSCGCTTAEPPKDPVAPGATGQIEATFHIGDRVGLQTKTINVQTDEAPDSNTKLTLKADVPKLLELGPTFLYWSKKQPDVEPRFIEVKVGKDFPVKKLTVTSTDPEIKTETETAPDGFRIKVTPPKTNRPINAALKVVPDFPADTPKTFFANVRVDAHPAASEAAAASPVSVTTAPVAAPAAAAPATPAATP